MTMPKRSRFRRVLKWTGVVMCAVILIAWGVSLRWCIIGINSQYTISIDNGYLTLGVSTRDPGVPKVSDIYYLPIYAPWHLVRIEPIMSLGFGLPRTLTVVEFVDVGAPVLKALQYKGLRVPFWLLLLTVMIPLALCIRRDRRSSPTSGHCPACGYNLTGNLSGICPECGEPCKPDASVT